MLTCSPISCRLVTNISHCINKASARMRLRRRCACFRGSRRSRNWYSATNPPKRRTSRMCNFFDNSLRWVRRTRTRSNKRTCSPRERMGIVSSRTSSTQHMGTCEWRRWARQLNLNLNHSIKPKWGMPSMRSWMGSWLRGMSKTANSWTRPNARCNSKTTSSTNSRTTSTYSMTLSIRMCVSMRTSSWRSVRTRSRRVPSDAKHKWVRNDPNISSRTSIINSLLGMQVCPTIRLSTRCWRSISITYIRQVMLYRIKFSLGIRRGLWNASNNSKGCNNWITRSSR